jgi:phosphoribosyl 1,2-cyclic phosphate phosphodiesterase
VASVRYASPVTVLFLGTGTSHGVPMIGCDCAVCRSSDPRDGRLRPSIHVTADDGTSIVVDTTPDFRQQALRHDLRRVDAVLYTHTHADHILGLDELRRYNHLTKRAVPLYGDAFTLAELQRVFAYAFDPAGPKGGGVPHLALHEVDDRPFTIGGQAIVPVPVRHGQRMILGYRFGRFAYLTDCNGIPEASYDRLRDLDVLVLDALRRRPHPTHFTVDEALAAAARIGARRTYFTHICHDLAHEATCATLPPGTSLAYDGLRLEIA